MDIMVTFPEEAAEREAFFQRISRFHAEAIHETVVALSWPVNQKMELLRAMICQIKG